MQKIADLQKLRAFAIVMVLLGHTGLAFPNALVHGYTGVSLFFVISGYVVTLSILRHLPESRAAKRPSLRFLRDFYVRRIFRIVPVAAFWVLVSVVVVEGIGRIGGVTLWPLPWTREVKWLLTGLYNYRFAAAHTSGMFGHYWSLAVEMHFYLLLPLLVLAVRDRRTLVAACVFGIVAVTTVLRAVTPSDAIGFLTHAQADALLMGVLLCLMSASGRPQPRLAELERRMPQWAKNAVFLSLATALLVIPSLFDGVWDPMLKYPVYTALASVMVLLAQRDAGWVLGGMPRLGAFFSYLGDRSFSLYVSHPILWVAIYPQVYGRVSGLLPSWVGTTGWGVFAQFTVMLIGALAVAELSYRFIEVPYIDYGKSIIGGFRKRESAGDIAVALTSAQVETLETATLGREEPAPG